jgi:hypothetical protein
MAIEDSYSPKPTVQMIQYVHDIKEWISPMLKDLHGHSEPLHFKFVKDGIATKFLYKHWTTDAWSEEGVTVLKVSTVRVYMYIIDVGLEVGNC